MFWMLESYVVMLLAFLITGSVVAKTNLSLGYFKEYFQEMSGHTVNAAFLLSTDRGYFYIALI